MCFQAGIRSELSTGYAPTRDIRICTTNPTYPKYLTHTYTVLTSIDISVTSTP